MVSFIADERPMTIKSLSEEDPAIFTLLFQSVVTGVVWDKDEEDLFYDILSHIHRATRLNQLDLRDKYINQGREMILNKLETKQTSCSIQ